MISAGAPSNPEANWNSQGVRNSSELSVVRSNCVRMAVIAGSMSVWAACADQHGGIWGASRHALTVGFAATMVFAIGPRILPHFGGIYKIFSKRLMFLSLLFLQVGCTLRVFFEPLAYEGIASLGWKVLPVSGVLELTAVLLFATNLSLTFLLGRSMFQHEPSARGVTEAAHQQIHSS